MGNCVVCNRRRLARVNADGGMPIERTELYLSFVAPSFALTEVVGALKLLLRESSLGKCIDVRCGAHLRQAFRRPFFDGEAGGLGVGNGMSVGSW